MGNPYTGETPIEIGGEELTLVFDWRALARMRAELGEDGQVRALGGDVEALAQLVEIGLARRHPGWDAGRVLDASPPLMATVDAVTKALNAAYFGPGGPPEDPPENPPKPTRETRSRRLWRRLTGRGSRRRSSGG